MNQKQIQNELKNAIENVYKLSKIYFTKKNEKITSLNLASSKSSLQHITNTDYMKNPQQYFHFQNGRIGVEIKRKERNENITYITEIYGLPQKDLREEFYTGKIKIENWGENTTIKIEQEDYEEAKENFNIAIENIQTYLVGIKRNFIQIW